MSRRGTFRVVSFAAWAGSAAAWAWTASRLYDDVQYGIGRGLDMTRVFNFAALDAGAAIVAGALALRLVLVAPSDRSLLVSSIAGAALVALGIAHPPAHFLEAIGASITAAVAAVFSWVRRESTTT